jgi:hypothetical protein
MPTHLHIMNIKINILNFACFFFLTIVIYSCNKNDTPDSSSKIETARLDLYFSSNYKYPLVYIEEDSLGRLITINNNPEYIVPIYYPIYVYHGKYKITAKVNRNPSNPMFNMLDSDSTWVKVVAVLNGDTVANDIGGPIVGDTLKSEVIVSFTY